jgi:Lon protease-like protein
MRIMPLPDEAGPLRIFEPWRYRMLFNKKMKTDVWALVGIVVTTIQIQQVTH